MRSTLVLLGLVVACGGSSSSGIDPAADASTGNAYSPTPDTTVVIGPAQAPGNGTVVTTPSGDTCVTLPNGVCVKPQEKCKSGEHADVIVDSAGKVVEIVCAPAPAAPTPIDAQGNIDIGKDNKGVVTIDGADDGVDVTGNVTSTGNNVTVYGAGPGVSVIGGNIAASGNNFTGRGVTVKGNVTIDGNNATLLLSVVEGDLIITGNNAVVAGCTVLGQIIVQGNNAVLIGNRVSKGIDPGKQNATCDGNVDANNVAISCASAGGGKK